MGMLEDFFLGAPHNDMERLLDRAVGQYRIESMSDSLLDSLWETEDEELDKESKRADIAYKKAMAASLPRSSEDYERAVNDGLSFKQTGVLAAFGSHLANRVPDTREFQPRSALADRLFSGTTGRTSNPELANDLYHSVLGRGAKGAKNAARSSLGTIARIFRR